MGCGWTTLQTVLTLPRTQRGNDLIFVVADRFSNMTDFVPCKNPSDYSNTADLFFQVVHLLQVLKTITIDKGTQYLGNFWWAFPRNLNKKPQ